MKGKTTKKERLQKKERLWKNERKKERYADRQEQGDVVLHQSWLNSDKSIHLYVSASKQMLPL